MEHNNTWKSSAGYVWALIGSAVGFANILSFSSKAYFHGGGAFLIPYTLSILALGFPLLCLEGVIGQYFGEPLVSSCGKSAGSLGKYCAWLAILSVGTIGSYYMLLTGWTIAYMYFTFFDIIPANTAHFLNDIFLCKTETVYEWGSLAYFQLACMLVVAFFSWAIVVRKIQSGIEKICSFFLPVLTIIIIFALGFVSFLPGALTGFAYYLIPNFKTLLEPRLWLDAFGHIFFSLSLGLGIITGYSCHTNKNVDIKRSMMWVILGDTFISFCAGFIIFGSIGYMSYYTGTPFSEIVVSTSPFEMGFVIFPTVLKMLGPVLSRCLGVLFFFCIFIAGITGVFSIVESVAGNIQSECNQSRYSSVTISILLMSLFASLFCFGNGQYIIGAIDPMVAGFSMLITGIAEIVIFMWLSPEIENHTIWKCGETKQSYVYYCLRYFAIMALVIVFCISFFDEITTGFSIAKCIRWGWFFLANCAAFLLIRWYKK